METRKNSQLFTSGVFLGQYDEDKTAMETFLSYLQDMRRTKKSPDPLRYVLAEHLER